MTRSRRPRFRALDPWKSGARGRGPWKRGRERERERERERDGGSGENGAWAALGRAQGSVSARKPVMWDGAGRQPLWDRSGLSITGILSSSDARRFLVLAPPLHPFVYLEASRVSRSASFSLRSAWRAPLLEGVVQAVRSAAVLAKALPKRRTWRAGVLPAPLGVRSWRRD